MRETYLFPMFPKDSASVDFFFSSYMLSNIIRTHIVNFPRCQTATYFCHGQAIPTPYVPRLSPSIQNLRRMKVTFVTVKLYRVTSEIIFGSEPKENETPRDIESGSVSR